MDCDILPQVASDWIVSYLNHLSQSSQSIARYWSSPNREQHFRRFGLANLYVPELKAIGKRIESSSRLEGHNLPDWVKPKASAKKADWTQALQLFFGGTNDLTLAFLSRRDWTTSNSFVAPDWSNNSNTTESSSATGAWGGSCGASSKVIKQQMISTTSTPSMEKAATSSTDKIKKRPLSKITPESNCIENRQTKKASDGTTVWIDLSTAAGEAAANRMWPKSRIRIKQEKTVCSPQHQRQQNQAIEENRLLFPRNHQEFSMISHMRVMGFTNDQEILAGLRHVEQQRDPMELRLGLYSMGQHLDAALIWIVVSFLAFRLRLILTERALGCACSLTCAIFMFQSTESKRRGRGGKKIGRRTPRVGNGHGGGAPTRYEERYNPNAGGVSRRYLRVRRE